MVGYGNDGANGDNPAACGAPDGCKAVRSDRPRYTLEELLVGVTPEALSGVFDWGPDVGREDIA